MDNMDNKTVLRGIICMTRRVEFVSAVCSYALLNKAPVINKHPSFTLANLTRRINVDCFGIGNEEIWRAGGGQ